MATDDGAGTSTSEVDREVQEQVEQQLQQHQFVVAPPQGRAGHHGKVVNTFVHPPGDCALWSAVAVAVAVASAFRLLCVCVWGLQNTAGKATPGCLQGWPAAGRVAERIQLLGDVRTAGHTHGCPVIDSCCHAPAAAWFCTISCVDLHQQLRGFARDNALQISCTSPCLIAGCELLNRQPRLPC